MKNDILDENKTIKERPFGLTILCIITFFISGLLGLLTGIEILHLLTRDFGYDTDRELYFMTIPFFVSFIFILIGAIYYWNLNKIGFYFILIGFLYPIGIISFFSYTSVFKLREDYLEILYPIIIVLICCGFLYLYIRNKKHLI